MATFFLTIRGDQLGTFTSMSGVGNGTDRVITLSGVQPVGTKDQTYTIRIDQASDGATQFTNGQFITILDAQGKMVMTQTTAQSDAEQGMAGGDEHLIFQGTKFVIDLTGVTPGTMTYGFADQAADPTRGDNDGELDFADTRRDFPCFATGTRIHTPYGPRPVEDLWPGDRVTDIAGTDHVLLWKASRHIMLDRPDHPRCPVLFRPHSLAAGGPETDLLVSPQHRVLVITAAGTEVLVPAKSLLGHRGIRLARGLRSVTYHALLLGRHAVLRANDAAAESLYPGRYILQQLPPFQRLQLLGHCPALLTDPEGGYGPKARPILTPSAAPQLPLRDVSHARSVGFARYRDARGRGQPVGNLSRK